MDGLERLVLEAAQEIDLGIFGVQDAGYVLSDASVAARDDEDLTKEVGGQARLGEGRLGREKVRPNCCKVFFRLIKSTCAASC